MNKKLNTILFMIGATVLNVVLLFFYLLAFLGIAGIFLPSRLGFFAQFVWIILFLGAMLTTWFTYKKIFKVLQDKIDFNKYFEPHLFHRKR